MVRGGRERGYSAMHGEILAIKVSSSRLTSNNDELTASEVA